jgi:DNA-binding transcriptional ArsR family regulator
MKGHAAAAAEGWPMRNRDGDRVMQIPQSIVHMPGLSHGAKLTWIALAEYAESEQLVCPGHEELACALEVSIATISGYLRELRHAGLLQVHRRGLGLTNVYTLYKPCLQEIEQ